MADNTGKKTSDSSNSFDTSSISGVVNIILSAFKTPTQPLTPLPPPLILTGAPLRIGLSSKDIASYIISRQSNAGTLGRPVGDVFADGPNVEEAMELIRVEEIVNALLNNARVDVVILPGISVTSVGVGNLGAPVISKGHTYTNGVGSGIIR